MHYLILTLILFHFPAFADQKLCSDPDIIIVNDKFKLEKNEKILICGTKDSELAWRKVPLEQAQYQLNVLLQSKGYLDAHFVNDGQSLKVYKGVVTDTKKLILTGTNGVVDVTKKRKIIGDPLTPKKLDEVKEWAELSARRQGHACPEILMRAEVWNQSMFADVEPGPVQTINTINRSGFGSLDPKALHRFEAFEAGDTYDVVDTQITTDRMMSQGLFQNAYITTVCNGDKVDLNFLMEVGKPKLLRFSLGASNEELPFTDVWFKNSRLDDRASSFLAQLHASHIRQSLELTSEFYVWPSSYGTFIGPRFKLERQKERTYETNKGEIGGDIGRAWDIFHMRLNGRAGPTINYLRTVTGMAPTEVKYLSWEVALKFMDHSYEAFNRNQAEGWIGDTKFTAQRKGVGAPVNIDKFELRFKNLYNLNDYSPPLVVIANRLEVIALNTHGQDQANEIIEIPVDMRIYYGGNENLRGFARQVLNNEGRGFITSALLGTELRLIQVIPYNLEPLILFDVAKLGVQPLQFIASTFISSGIGLRWRSPFGTLRFSAARGQIWGSTLETAHYPQEWIYNVSFGQEF